MAKEQKSADQPSGAAEQAMAQARSAADIYFEYVKQAISATPSGGNEFTERIKECAEKNITMTQEYLKALEPSAEFPGYGSRPDRVHAVNDECGGRTNTEFGRSIHQNSSGYGEEASVRHVVIT